MMSYDSPDFPLYISLEYTQDEIIVDRELNTYDRSTAIRSNTLTALYTWTAKGYCFTRLFSTPSSV